MNHSTQYYEKQAAISHAKYTTAINIGEDKVAAKELADYEDYIAMLKQAMQAQNPTS